MLTFTRPSFSLASCRLSNPHYYQVPEAAHVNYHQGYFTLVCQPVAPPVTESVLSFVQQYHCCLHRARLLKSHLSHHHHPVRQAWIYKNSSTTLPVGPFWYNSQDGLWWLGKISWPAPEPGSYIVRFLDDPGPIKITLADPPLHDRCYCCTSLVVPPSAPWKC